MGQIFPTESSTSIQSRFLGVLIVADLRPTIDGRCGKSANRDDAKDQLIAAPRTNNEVGYLCVLLLVVRTIHQGKTRVSFPPNATTPE